MPNPSYPRHRVAASGWTGIVCLRQLALPKPVPIFGGPSHERRGTPDLYVTYELCRGEIVERNGRVSCSYCGTVPSWA